MSKNFFDPSLFSGVLEGVDLFTNSIRKSMEFDFYDSRTTFKAIVISTPQPLNSAAASGIDPTDVGSAATTTSTAKWVFKGRIIEHNSPHDFIPDPCNPVIADNKGAARQLINMHTTFTTAPGMDKPEIYNIVLVELDKGPFSYNLQFGRCLQILQNASVQASAYAKATDCKSAASAFDGADRSALTAALNINFIRPTWVGTVTSPWSPMRCRDTTGDGVKNKCAPHKGIDIAAPVNTPVYAVCPGTATARVSRDCPRTDGKPGHDKNVHIQCKFPNPGGSGFNTEYSVVYRHLETVQLGGDPEFGVTEGASPHPDAKKNKKEVVSGDFIAGVGGVGVKCSSGPHLHFELYHNGKAIDPAGLLTYTSAVAGGDTGVKSQYSAFVEAFSGDKAVYSSHEVAAEEVPPAGTKSVVMVQPEAAATTHTRAAAEDPSFAPDAHYGRNAMVDGADSSIPDDVLATLSDKATGGQRLTQSDWEEWADQKGKHGKQRRTVIVDWAGDGEKWLYDYNNDEYYTPS